jgi:molybdopterin converting factor subunit 1
MKVRLRLFGAVSERAQFDEEAIEVPDGSTAGDVLRLVGDRFPSTRALLGRVSVAVNLEVVSGNVLLSDDDEVALLPPVAGGAAKIVTGLRDRAPMVEEALAEAADPGAGGTVVFLGTVRDQSDTGSVERLEYTAYAEMAELVLRRVAEEAAERWPLVAVVVLHAVGDLVVGDTTVIVACSGAHRSEAFDACRYVIDEVKRRVPIWKKEIGPEGQTWVGLDPGTGTSAP